MQTGIIDHWDLWFRPMPLQCQGNIKSVDKPKSSKTLKMKNRPPALSLKNLTGAFIVLLIGFSLSFLAFLCEQIVSIPNRHNRRLEKTKGDKFEQEPVVNVEIEVDTQSKRIDQEKPSTDSGNEFGNKSDPEMNENEATNTENIINIDI